MQRKRGAWIPCSRRLKLRRRCVPADRVIALNTDFRKTSNQGGIAWHVLQTNQRWPIHTGVRRLAEVVTTVPTETEISDKGIRECTRESNNHALRTIAA